MGEGFVLVFSNSSVAWSGGFLRSSVGKESAGNAEDQGSIPGLGRSPGEENGNPFQYSSLENPMDLGSWRAIVHEVAKVRHDLETTPPPLKHGHFMEFFEIAGICHQL